MGYKLDKSVPPMERELKYLLADLCVIWGWCIPPSEQEKIAKVEFYHASDFAWDIVEAEGLNPVHEKKWMKRIARKFTERFGQDTIDILTFKDRVRGIKEEW